MAGAVDVNFFRLCKVGVPSLHTCRFSCGFEFVAHLFFTMYHKRMTHNIVQLQIFQWH
jgi:hypothetical protein